jgi:ABC-type transport system involved in cytochrome c biogenesis ATPase subunit
MRISEISVARLFGLFDHIVPMNLDERVTIIYGPNGYGKTTLLHLVDSLFAGRYSDIRRVPFRDISITFDSGDILQVIRVDARPQSQPRVKGEVGPALMVHLRRKGEKAQNATLPDIPAEMLNMPVEYVSRAIPYLERISRSQWRDERSGEIVGLEEIYRTHGQFFGPERIAGEPEWLRDFRKTVRIRFIESQRLLRVTASRGQRDDSEPVRPAVLIYSRELAKQIQQTLAEYATLSQSLDRSFPKRLVEQTRTRDRQTISAEGLRAKLQQLEDRRTSLTEAGLLDREYERFDIGYVTDPTLTESVLPIYAEDAERKLQVFDNIAPRIELLTSIVNAHFQYKVMTVSKDKGFEFATRYPGESAKPRPLALSHLSSGEQHMLVLLYELLFTVQPNSLIMIDEPEISLHVAWQLELLRDIQKVTALTGIDVLLATHAPGVINERMDLAVELQAPIALQAPAEVK